MEFIKLLFTIGILSAAAWAQTRPNVIIVMTDDQGYGDIGAHRNEDIITPHLDKMHDESFRLTNFHVNALCAPTRAAFMTGRYSMRSGVWATTFGRSHLHNAEVTMGEVFKDNGYKTGLFGKWHLGQGGGMGPRFQGFDEVITFGSGVINEIPSYWQNTMWDGTYLHNGEWELYPGYCTDVWFTQAMNWIKTNKEEPFFAFIAPNAPHAPFQVDAEYSDLYNGTPVEHEVFYGMITNIDENFGKLRDFLDAEGLTENTILIFMTDNGTVAGQGVNWDYWNDGLRGSKGARYDGGHLVPFFMHWPGGNIRHGQDDNTLTAQIDLLPTFISMFDFTPPGGVDFDGIDISEVFTSQAEPDWKDRILFMPRQGSNYVPQYNSSTVMKGNWRLVLPSDLTDMTNDRGQQNNIYNQNPDIVKELLDAYDVFWEELKPMREGYNWTLLGDEIENPTMLTSFAWQPHGNHMPWVSSARSNVKQNGYWTVHFNQDGRYNFTLRKTPHYVSQSEVDRTWGDVTQARIAFRQLPDDNHFFDTTVNASNTDGEVNIDFDVKSGNVVMQTWLDLQDSQGAFYTYVTRLTPNTGVSKKDGPEYRISMQDLLERLGRLDKDETLKIYNSLGRLLFDRRKGVLDVLQIHPASGLLFAKFESRNKVEMFKLVQTY